MPYNKKDEIQVASRGPGNVVAHPSSLQQRLDRAIELFDTTDSLDVALREFISLIDAGCSEAYFFAGCIYEDEGRGVERDLNKALFYYQKSVDELGYVEGYLALARLHYYGIGVAQDFNKAFKYYSSVAEHKDNAIADMMLGRMYQYGQGVGKDSTKARAYYLKAAKTGNVYAIKNLALLEEELGNRFKGLFWRLKAGISAFLIGKKNMKDYRLRAG